MATKIQLIILVILLNSFYSLDSPDSLDPPDEDFKKKMKILED